MRISCRNLWKPFLVSFLLVLTGRESVAQVIPHNQDRPPNAAFSPQDAARRMTVPPDFTVEVVASEPMIVNPVAMTIDERGRFWITESLEYPRKPAGPGRDRVKVLEDTDGDGSMDKATVFAEGLNIPSGIAVGGGGVWVANAPDLLFLQDTDGDGKADKSEVVLTGFGRDDTHELPNSLTWGPDGWLYGLNGVFNRSVVKYRGKTYDFTCALFRIHPKTREFELFAEGVSNSWGLAWNNDGEAFLSACVIDHLWHLTETGYYHRQGGPYPPFTWKIESIVDYKHQKAAYCGLHFFDSDAYPPEYREKLLMGNIHGNCLNMDGLKRKGSTYQGVKLPDFLNANDTWFMPVVQKTGPDGCLYVLDWYDQYHCYQDANRDPAGIDRLKGRLYRVRYKDTPRAKPFDLAKESDDQLITRLGSPNVYFRDVAQRLLQERAKPETLSKLEALALDRKAPRKARMHALWSRVGAGSVDAKFLIGLMDDPDPGFRAWGVRASGNQKVVDVKVRERIVALLKDEAPEVRLQVVIASRKVEEIDSTPLLLDALALCGGDLLTKQIVWRNLIPALTDHPEAVVNAILTHDLTVPIETNLRELIPRCVDLLASVRRPGALELAGKSHEAAVKLVVKLFDVGEPAREALSDSLGTLAEKVSSGEIQGERAGLVHDELAERLTRILGENKQDSLGLNAAMVALAWRDPQAIQLIEATARNRKANEDVRLTAIASLAETGDLDFLDRLIGAVSDPSVGSGDFRGKIVALLGRYESPKVARSLLETYPKVDASVRGKIVDLLTQRASWSRALIDAVKSKHVDPNAMNLNQVRRILATKDPGLAAQVRAIWGTVRESRSPQRELVIDAMRQNLSRSQGDPVKGQVVFKNLCAQCHKIYGEGQEVGPEVTANGRSSFDQLLSNVFDPSLVIGEAYQATTVATIDGRVLSGLLVENTPERVVLKLQGGKTETILRGEVDETKVSPISLMPEDLEKQLKAQEIVDLFSFLALDKPPGDPSAKRLPGTPANLIKR